MTIGRSYFVRQAQTILKYAKWTNDPVLHSVLIEKATELTSKIDDEARPRTLALVLQTLSARRKHAAPSIGPIEL